MFSTIFRSAVSSDRTFSSSSGKLFFGSVPSHIDKTAAFEVPFSGCIGDATFNGVVINFGEIAEGKDAAIGRCSGPGQQILPRKFSTELDESVSRGNRRNYFP